MLSTMKMVELSISLHICASLLFFNFILFTKLTFSDQTNVLELLFSLKLFVSDSKFLTYFFCTMLIGDEHS